MISDVLTFQADPDPCRELSCDTLMHPVGVCRKQGCGFRWMREAAKDRAERERKDAARRAER